MNLPSHSGLYRTYLSVVRTYVCIYSTYVCVCCVVCSLCSHVLSLLLSLSTSLSPLLPSPLPLPALFLQVQAVSAEGSGNYSDPASFTVETFPVEYIGAIAAGAVLICCGIAFVFILALLIGHCCKVRRYELVCVCVCVCVCVHACLYCALNLHMPCS